MYFMGINYQRDIAYNYNSNSDQTNFYFLSEGIIIANNTINANIE